jgi:biotin carboxyl carrier protein
MTVVVSEVTGLVSRIEAAPGQSVEEGDTIVIVESMKMEIPIVAPRAGTVKEIHVQQGDLVKDDQPVAVLG